MNYAIIGFGRSARPRQGVRSQGHRRIRRNHARPGKLCIGRGRDRTRITPTTLAEAVKADVIFLAVRFQSHPDVAKALPNWQGKIIVDVTNAYGVSTEELGGRAFGQGRRAGLLGRQAGQGLQPSGRCRPDQDPAVHGGRRVVFLTSDDEEAATQIGALAENLGFAPVKLGGLSEGGLLVQAHGQELGPPDLQGPGQVRLMNTPSREMENSMSIEREHPDREGLLRRAQPWRQRGSAGAGRRRRRVDHSGQGLAAGRNAPRTRRAGGSA
jgi:predicted dinucleotide-binding enzyme